MTQREFIDKLVSCLNGKVSTGTIQENVTYYEQYFYNEMRRGLREEEICISLGSPQLIAKSILEAEKYQSDRGYAAYEESGQYDSHQQGYTRERERRQGRTPGWLMLFVALTLFFLIISVVVTIFTTLAPIILPICIVLFIVQIFKNTF